MKTLNGSLRLRPTRIGFLVSPTNLEAVRHIMRICTCLWGGAYNPIIPVCDELPPEWQNDSYIQSGTLLADGYIRFFEPDVFVECEPGLAEKIGFKNGKLDYFQPRVVPLNNFFGEDPKEGPKLPIGLNMLDVYETLYKQEYKFLSRHDNRVGIFDTDTPDGPFIEAVFGGFPQAGFLSKMEQFYTEALNPKRISPTPENWLKVVTENYRDPLQFTFHGIKRENGWGFGPTVYILDPQKAVDLIDLWNLRQFCSDVLPINIEWINQSRDYLRDVITANYRPLRGNSFGTLAHTTVQFARSIVKERTESMKEMFSDLPKGSVVYQHFYDRIWHTNRQADWYQQPSRIRISAASTNIELSVSEEHNNLSVRFASLSPEFASSYGDGADRWVNILQPVIYSTDKFVATVLPSNFKNVQFPRLRLGGGASISREGWVLPQNYKGHDEYLQLMTGRQAIIEWLALYNVEAKPSDPGRIAEQIISAVGGFWGTRHLADKEILMHLDKMAKSTRKYHDGKIEEFPDRSMPVREWADLIQRRKKKRRRIPTSLDDFVKANILKLGLVIDCPNCMKKNWYGLHDLDSLLTCERCLKKYEFPQGSLNFEKTPWEYRVVGPFAVPDYAGGAHATVLSLRFFSANLGMQSKLTYSTNLDITIDKAAPLEVDFALWYKRDSGFGDEEPALAFGEAKSFAEESFKSVDVERLKALAIKFPSAFLVFAVLKDALSDNEKALISELALWGRSPFADDTPQAPVIVLTGIELFSEWHIEESWTSKGGRHAEFASIPSMPLDNLWTLANCTQQLYLDLPDMHAAPARKGLNATN